MQEDSDALFVKQLVQKDKEAFREAISRFQPSMKVIARKIVGNNLAEEVVQDAWISIMKGLPSFQGKSSLKTWVFAIVANEAKMKLRKEKPTVSLDAMSEPEFSSRFKESGSWESPPLKWDLGSPESILAAEALNDCISNTVEGLPDLQSSVLQLRETEGMKFDEICNVLEVSESNVRVLMHRARQSLYLVIEHFQSTGDCLSANQAFKAEQ